MTIGAINAYPYLSYTAISPMKMLVCLILSMYKKLSQPMFICWAFLLIRDLYRAMDHIENYVQH